MIEAETSEELAVEMNKFGKRAESCKKGKDPREDNMLKIVNEGRYAGLDIRHINESYPDYEDSKVNLVINKVVEIYNETMENKSTQVIFSDLSTPKENEFNIYDDIKNKLIVAILIIMEYLFRLRKEFIDNNWHCAVAILIIMECLFRRVFYKKSEILNKNLNNSKI